jgi:hypothetical protein
MMDDASPEPHLMIRPTFKLFALALLTLALPVPAVRGGFVVSMDAGAGPNDPRPNSEAGEAKFYLATAGAGRTVIDFLGLPVGQPPDGTPFAITKDGSVVATTTNTDHPAALPPGFQFGITNLPNDSAAANNAAYGYSITGTQHFQFVPVLNGGTSSFSVHATGAGFNAFGFYITGLGDQPNSGTLHVRFNDGGNEDIVVPGSTSGGVLYFSFLGTAAPIHDFQLVMTGVTGPNRDVFSIDDITLGTVGAVPEPPAWVLTGIGLVAWLGRRALGGRARRG